MPASGDLWLSAAAVAPGAWGFRIAPLAIMGKCGPARQASRAPPASEAIEQARPLM